MRSKGVTISMFTSAFASWHYLKLILKHHPESYFFIAVQNERFVLGLRPTEQIFYDQNVL